MVVRARSGFDATCAPAVADGGGADEPRRLGDPRRSMSEELLVAAEARQVAERARGSALRVL
jgi:hypothetical protein